LAELVIDPEGDADLSGLTDAELLVALTPYYDFLGDDAEIVVTDDVLQITTPDSSGYQLESAQYDYERAVKLAERGSYDRAIRQFRDVLDILPLHTDARRNLAMAYLESGDPETARELLVQALRLNPQDTWAYLLLGNIAARHDEDRETAERLYEKAVELSPDDHIVITNYAAMLAQRGETEKADGLLLKAIQLEPKHPNAYYALAKMAYDTGDAQRAVNVLDNMFDIAAGPNVRNQPFFDEARRLYLSACTSAAEAAYDDLMALVEQRASELETLTGYPVRLEQNTSLQIPATTRVAWAYGADHHLIRYHAAPVDPRDGAHRDGGGGPRGWAKPHLHSDACQRRDRQRNRSRLHC
jgi:FimV-like protein